MSNIKRIGKNTLLLYFRHLLIMLASLYTVRVVLTTLGARDYGIYNVVAGIVTMLGFLNSSMATGSQRHFSFAIGSGDPGLLKRVFSINVIIYFLIGLFVVLLAETVGLYFLRHKLIIPDDRINAAGLIYQFAILSFVFTIAATPYRAVIIAHENMSVYAYVSIAEVILNLLIAFLLKIIPYDKLSVYGILICGVTVITTVIYRTICKNKYKECIFRFYFDKTLFREIASYSGWSLFAPVAGIFKNQFIDILLNQFFNPVVVAARSVSSQINTAVSSFSNNFNMALRPPMVKSYAAGQDNKMISLIFIGTKATFFLMYIFVLPFVLEMPIMLSIWLKSIPEYLVVFARLTLLDRLIWSINYPLDTAVLSAKKIGLYQIVIAGSLLFNLPFSLIALLLHYPAYSVLVIGIIISFITFFLRLVIIRRFIIFPIRLFLKEVIVPVSVVALAASVLPLILFCSMRQSMLRLSLVILASVISLCACMYCMGINTLERKQITEVVVNKLMRK